MGYGSEFVELECDLKDEIGVLYQAFNDTNQQLYEYMSNVQAQAYRDSLTGLKNRTAYAEAVIKMEKRIAEEEPRFGVAIFDMNNLKIANDTYGHEQGNELIVRVAKLIAGVFYRSVIYRVGGDEFVVILEDADYDEYESLFETFEDLCAEEQFSFDDVNIPISVAYGVAIYDKEIDSSFENVFHRADGLMYRKKREMKEL